MYPLTGTNIKNPWNQPRSLSVVQADRTAVPLRTHPQQETSMLYYALIFFIVAIVAAVFGFGGIASASAGIAQILFFVFVVLLIGTLVLRAIRS